jgi:signal transduction histidine kinase
VKTRSLILIFILVCASLFTVLIVRFTNYNLERTFRDSSRNAFYLLSFIVDHYLDHEKEIEETHIRQIRSTITPEVINTKQILISKKSYDYQGIWIFEENSTLGTTQYENVEQEIVNFYRRNLRGKNEHTLIFLEGKPFFLVNTTFGSKDILLLSAATVLSGIRIEQILDSLITSSSLRYFAIINANNTPVLFSTVYENFLPLRGAGQHTIETPEGRIFQIEENIDDGSIIAGFDMESLSKIIRNNNLFLMLIILVFIISEGVLFASYTKFERFKLEKEKEINRFKEVGALSTGFAHEFRNSLHTLSLLAKELDKESKSILLDETNRMKAIMDSLRLLSTKDIKREEISVLELINESIDLLDHSIIGKAVAIKKDIDEDDLIQGNRPLLVTAFSNIIKNCIEARARTIKISTHKKAKKVRIDIADDGKGIDRAIIDEIFDPFFSKKGQSGIGLYLTKRIVELHDGKIELIRNRYTIFSVILPA